MTMTVDQPAPKAGFGDICLNVFARFARVLSAQVQKGFAKYGTRLQKWNGRNPIADAWMELVDGSQYMQQADEERTDMLREIERADEMSAERAALDVQLDGALMNARQYLHGVNGQGVGLVVEAVERAQRIAKMIHTQGRYIAPDYIRRAYLDKTTQWQEDR